MMHEISFPGLFWLDWLARLVLLGLSLSAGFVVFTVGLNPRFVRLPKKRFRKILTVLGLIVTMVGFGLYGVLAKVSLINAVLPLGILAGTSLSQKFSSWQHQVKKKPEGISDGERISLLRPLTTTDLVTRHFSIKVENWRGPALKIVHLSDLHVSKRLPMAYFKSVVQRICDEKPDLVLVTGDFVTFPKDAGLLPEALAGLQAPLGVYGILGNHDLFKAEGEVLLEASRIGIQMIGGKTVTVPKFPGLALAGDEYPWGSRLPAGNPPGDGNETLLVLTHTPDNIYRLARSLRPPEVVFAGHLHAGQIRLPYLGPVIVPSNYGRQFAQGHFLVRNTHLFVSAGVGAAAPPVRIWCQPEILVVNIGA